jgi:hypothetical protein
VFRQKWVLIVPVHSPVLRQKAAEVALKLNIEFTPSNGCHNQFRKYVGLSRRNVSTESKSVIEEEVANTTFVL